MKLTEILTVILTFVLFVALNSGCNGDDLEPPVAPGNLMGELINGETIRLVWTVHSDNEIGIEIQESVGSDDNFSTVVRLPQGAETDTLRDKTPFTDYYFRVRAYNDAGNSGFTNVAYISTAIDPPIAPSNLNVTALTENDIRLTWRDRSGNESGFEIEESIGNDASFIQIASGEFPDNELLLTDKVGLTDYYYRVRAFNAGGNSDYTPIIMATTENVVPARPGDFTAVVEYGAEIQTNWTDRSILEEGYRIYEQEGGSGGFVLIHITEPDEDSLLITGRDQRTNYAYYAVAFNDIGLSQPSDTARVETGSEVWSLELWLRDTMRVYETFTNVPIGGQVVNQRGTPQDRIQVFFGNIPDDMGNITPWSWTDVSSGSGLSTDVVFSGIRAGHVQLFGYITDEDDFEISRDTLNVEIVEPE